MRALIGCGVQVVPGVCVGDLLGAVRAVVDRRGKVHIVRFHWFAQQYYTKLAADFGESVRSAWVTPPTAHADPAQVGRDYHMYLRLMQGADRLGWDSLLLNEHHQNSLAMTP